MCLIAGFRVLLELHGPPEGILGPILFRLILGWRGRKRLLPITNGLLDVLRRSYPHTFTPGEVVIASNGVELERYETLPDPPAARQRLGLKDQLTAGYTGHLYPGRGLDILVALARSYPSVQFLWVGGRPGDVERWQAKLRREQIGNIVMVGFVENQALPLYQAAADILLMPYERKIEGSGGGNSAEYCSPMKMFEYLACGRAILSSDLPVLREVLSEHFAVFSPPEDADAWITTFESLITDPERRKALGRMARQEAEHYSWRRRAERCLEGFE